MQEPAWLEQSAPVATKSSKLPNSTPPRVLSVQWRLSRLRDGALSNAGSQTPDLGRCCTIAVYCAGAIRRSASCLAYRRDVGSRPDADQVSVNFGGKRLEGFQLSGCRCPRKRPLDAEPERRPRPEAEQLEDRLFAVFAILSKEVQAFKNRSDMLRLPAVRM